jgi:hypothetical protein
MSGEQKGADLAGQARELFRALEAESGPVEPGLLEKYAGEWVVVDRGRVVAHGKDGAKVAQEAPVEAYPLGELFYVPTRDEQEGVRILAAGMARRSEEG